jgi:hypothetical protein
MYPKLIALTGYKGSGKDSCADAITGQMGPYKEYSFAKPVKQICEIAFGLTWEEMEGNRKLKEQILDRYPEESPRRLMQQVGTDLFRTLWPDVWIECFNRHIFSQKDARICVTDMRFPNELQAVRAHGGLTIRVVRTDQPESIDPHPSERYINQLDVDHEILAATGELESLHKQIRLVTGLHTQLNMEDF